MIVADTGAILGLLDSRDRHHQPLRALYDDDPDAWVLPWAVLPEVDYLAQAHLGPKVEAAFLEDLAEGRYLVEWGEDPDLARAREICDTYRALKLGLVDGVVIAVAERLGAGAIATLDLRHFGAVKILGSPRLLPRDL